MSTYYFECLTFIYVLKYISAFVYNVCQFTFFSFVYGRSDTASALGSRPTFLNFLSLLLFSFLFCVRQCLINTVFFLGRDDRWLRGARECLLLVPHLTLGFVFILPFSFLLLCLFSFVCLVSSMLVLLVVE